MVQALEHIEAPEGMFYDPSLVLYLPLHQLDGSSFMDKSAYGHLATVTGALWRLDGRTFNGTADLIDLGSSSVLAPGTGSWSVGAWIKTSSASQQLIIGKGYAGANWWVFWVRSNQSGTLFAATSNNGATGFILDSVVNTSDGNWHQLWGVRDTSGTETFYLYIPDKQYVNSVATVGGNCTGGAYNTQVGHEAGFVGHSWFDGIIGEVLLYNRALTALEIQQNYLATKWRFV